MKKRPFYFVLTVGFICVILIEIIVLAAIQKQAVSTPYSEKSLTEMAESVVAKCSTSSYRPSCYDMEIPKLMEYISMEDAFKVTKIVQDLDREYVYCHVLGHELSAKEIQKDPSRWKELVSRCPSGICSNGCLHGGFQERFRSEALSDDQIGEIKPDLVDLCEERPNWRPTGLEQASCYHAVGHLTMYMTGADIEKSVGLCKEIAVKDDGRNFDQLCFDGVFMQIFQPLEPEDFALVSGMRPVKEEVSEFCGKYDGKVKGSCLSESWPLFREELQNPEGLVEFCSRSELQEQDRCYSAVFFVLTAQFQFDNQKISTYCEGLPQDRHGLCFANAAARMIETDYRNISKAVELCRKIDSSKDKEQCFRELLLYSTYNYHKGSREFYEMCNALPTDWKENCLN